jgi:hypothetical protein
MTTYLMHYISGDVATVEDWRGDFESMDLETWFGLPIERCEGLHWLDDNIDSSTGKPIFVEVVKDKNGEWVEA